MFDGVECFCEIHKSKPDLEIVLVRLLQEQRDGQQMVFSAETFAICSLFHTLARKQIRGQPVAEDSAEHFVKHW